MLSASERPGEPPALLMGGRLLQTVCGGCMGFYRTECVELDSPPSEELREFLSSIAYCHQCKP